MNKDMNKNISQNIKKNIRENTNKNINTKIDISGKRVLLVGFWGNKNMGDELILLGNIKLLLEAKKEIYVISQDNNFLKKFLSQFIDIKKIIFIQELPRGLRSGIKYFFKNILELRYFFRFDEIILGGGEILTEENPNAYRYWLWSIRPALYLKKTKLTIMGGIQIPKLKNNLRLFKKILAHTKQIYVRDFQALEAIKKFGYKHVSFFMDTSFFVFKNWKKYKSPSQKYIIINLNSNGENFFGDVILDLQEYIEKGYIIYYLPVSKGTDNDIIYFERIKKKIRKDAKLKLLDRTEDFESFLKVIGGAEKVIGTRLHLYLISKFIGLETIVYPYQKKIIRMQEVLTKILPFVHKISLEE